MKVCRISIVSGDDGWLRVISVRLWSLLPVFIAWSTAISGKAIFGKIIYGKAIYGKAIAGKAIFGKAIYGK